MDVDVTADRERPEHVSAFQYQGLGITYDGSSTIDFQQLPAMAMTAYGSAYGSATTMEETR